MNSAYLYIRVSTDEQKKKGYSLPEQEDRLLKYCSYNNIEVKGIYREDFSAKNFNRPEWKKLINVIKSSPKQQENNIVFIKWDRFSRNIVTGKYDVRTLRNLSAEHLATTMQSFWQQDCRVHLSKVAYSLEGSKKDFRFFMR